MNNLKGFYPDEVMPNDRYHQNSTHFSSTTLKKALKGAKYFHESVILRLAEDQMNEGALALGNYLHIALLQPHLLESTCEVYPAKTRAGKDFKAFQQDNLGKTIITMNELQTATDIMYQFNTQFVDLGDESELACSKLFQGGTAEESLFTSIEGVNIKVRFDYRVEVNGDIVIRDLKTTSSTANSVQEATYICGRYDYFLSAALYVDALKTMYPEGTNVYFDLVFASKQDGRINVYRVGENTLQEGRNRYMKAINNIKRWEKNGYKEGLRVL